MWSWRCALQGEADGGRASYQEGTSKSSSSIGRIIPWNSPLRLTAVERAMRLIMSATSTSQHSEWMRSPSHTCSSGLCSLTVLWFWTHGSGQMTFLMRQVPKAHEPPGAQAHDASVGVLSMQLTKPRECHLCFFLCPAAKNGDLMAQLCFICVCVCVWQVPLPKDRPRVHHKFPFSCSAR